MSETTERERGAEEQTEEEQPASYMQWLNVLAAMKPGKTQTVQIGSHELKFGPPTFGVAMRAFQLVQRGLTKAEELNPESSPLTMILSAFENWGLLGAIGQIGEDLSFAMDLLIGQKNGWCGENLSPFEFAQLLTKYAEVLPMEALVDFIGPLVARAADQQQNRTATALRRLLNSIDREDAPSDGPAPSTPTSSENTG